MAASTPPSNGGTRGDSRVLFALALALAVCAFAQTPSSVWDGVYTEAQATSGLALYKQECASCHGMSLEGAGQFPPLSGDDFKANWNGQQLSDLFEKMRLSMPADHPGKLSGEQNAEIL
jgi:mono/diheme cytochrome c family protein